MSRLETPGGLNLTGVNITAMAMADPVNQIIMLTLPDGSQLPVSLSEVNYNQVYIVSSVIGYSVSIGASFVMLAVILTMTPKTKFWRLPTYINMAALCNNIIRDMLLAIFFRSSWQNFYTFYTGDYSYVTPADFRDSIASCVLAITQNMLLMSALMLQAWAMTRLWPDLYKWGIVTVSGILISVQTGFMFTCEVYQILSFLPNFTLKELYDSLWIRYVFLALEVTCISWFCLMFNLKLVVHMWTNRSFLPSAKGLSAMDVLVMTNGVLMLIPVFFAGLQYANNLYFEVADMVYCSVIIILPLGTLVAQRIADPAAFNSSLSNCTTRIGNAPGRYGTASSNKKPLLDPSWSQSSDKDSGVVFSGHPRGSKGGLSGKTGITSTISGGNPISSLDRELAQIDGDVEMGHVRVDRVFHRSEERL